MFEPTHAPGWRGKPIRRGPIVGMNDDAGNQIGTILIGISATIAALLLLSAGGIWLVDFLAGHVHP